jgi:hypothetical protein
LLGESKLTAPYFADHACKQSLAKQAAGTDHGELRSIFLKTGTL